MLASEHAEKQYDATDPDNRLVASELERRWNEALQKVQQLEARVEQAMRVQQVSPATKEEFEALAGDLEAVWSRSDTDARLKKRIVRTLSEEVVVDVDGQAGEIVAVVHWKGGLLGRASGVLAERSRRAMGGQLPPRDVGSCHSAPCATSAAAGP